MTRYWLSAGLVIALFAGVGCSSTGAGEDSSGSGIDDSSEGSLSELLQKPRADLAALGQEWSAKVRDQEKAIRLGELRQTILPDVRVPFAPPVFREATYSTARNISLPPYAAEGKDDAALAMHLARHGDVDAALQLAGETSADTHARIESFRGKRNYPVEWTRLVGLMQHCSEVRLTTGDADGARELIAIHHQLRKVLDSKAAEGPLGTALLGRGRRTLSLAVPALRGAGQKDHADKIAKALEDWGPVPAGLNAVELGGNKTEIAAILGAQGHGKAIQTTSPARALDLMALPVPTANAQAVTALFDTEDRLSQVLVTYGLSSAKTYPDPKQFGYLFEEQGLSPKNEAKTPVQWRCSYAANGVECGLVVLQRSAASGAVAVFRDADKRDTAPPPLPRDFGAVNLDRGFEQNRLILAPEGQGESIQTKKQPALAKITNPLVTPAPILAVVKKVSSTDATASVTLRYPEEVGQTPLHQLLSPLWRAFGPARFEESEGEKASALVLAWEEGATRYSLRLSNGDDQPVEFLAQNVRGTNDSAPNGASFDLAERKARINAGKPLRRLPRQLEDMRLGQTKEEVQSALARWASVVKLTFADGVGVSLNGDAPKTSEVVARQVLLRFDSAGKVAEVRVRYEAGPAAKPNSWPAGFLATWKKIGGAAAASPAPWSAVWDDPPPKKAPSVLTWRDDLTWMSFYCDGGVADVTVRDCPAEYPDGAPLPAFQYLPRGPEGCLLATTKAAIQKSSLTTGKAAEVDLVLYPPKTSRYDAYMIWFEGDRVSRVVARHRPTKADAVSKALTDAWGRDLLSFGWAYRQESNADDELQGVGWLDDRTRIRTYWQETEKGNQRVYTEWKDLPPQPKNSATK